MISYQYSKKILKKATIKIKDENIKIKQKKSIFQGGTDLSPPVDCLTFF